MLAAGTAAQASISAVLIGLSALAPALRDDLGLSLAQIGALFAATNLGQMATLLLWGFAADRAGERAVIAAGLTAAGAALAGAAFVSTFVPLFCLLAAAGALGAGVNAGSGRAVLRWFAPEQRGLALGIRQTAIPIGGVVAALTLPALAHWDGPRAAFLGLAAFCLAGALAGALVVRDRPGEPPVAPAVPWTLRDRSLWLLSAGSGLYIVAQTGLIGFVVLFLHDERGVGASRAAAVLAAMQVLGAALRIGTGIWSDRLGARFVPLRRVGLALAAAAGISAALLDAPLPLLVPVLIVAGGLSMGWNGLSFAAAAELGGHARSGAAIGFQQTALAVAGAAASVAFAAVAGVSWYAAFGLAAAAPLLGRRVLAAVADR